MTKAANDLQRYYELMKAVEPHIEGIMDKMFKDEEGPQDPYNDPIVLLNEAREEIRRLNRNLEHALSRLQVYDEMMALFKARSSSDNPLAYQEDFLLNKINKFLHFNEYKVAKKENSNG